ncbi:hypothetical protein niasHT_011304 [Heterodera trifolii]|uniref:Uncharacterized protein n=1 Tax=Heterodera trifolii TaxID=157864 RepID=A0ABD2LA31_9BILA
MSTIFLLASVCYLFLLDYPQNSDAASKTVYFPCQKQCRVATHHPDGRMLYTYNTLKQEQNGEHHGKQYLKYNTRLWTGIDDSKEISFYYKTSTGWCSQNMSTIFLLASVCYLFLLDYPQNSDAASKTVYFPCQKQCRVAAHHPDGRMLFTYDTLKQEQNGEHHGKQYLKYNTRLWTGIDDSKEISFYYKTTNGWTIDKATVSELRAFYCHLVFPAKKKVCFGWHGNPLTISVYHGNRHILTGQTMMNIPTDKECLEIVPNIEFGQMSENAKIDFYLIHDEEQMMELLGHANVSELHKIDEVTDFPHCGQQIESETGESETKSDNSQ